MPKNDKYKVKYDPDHDKGKKISLNMSEAIKNIEKNLSIKFEGSTFREAHDFIGKHLNESRRVYSEKRKEMMDQADSTRVISDKMKNAIEKIEVVTGIKWEGEGFRSAYDFIGKHLKKLKAVSKKKDYKK